MDYLLPILLMITIAGAGHYAGRDSQVQPEGSRAYRAGDLPDPPGPGRVDALHLQYAGAAAAGGAVGGVGGWQFPFEYAWLPILGLKIFMGVDAISLWLVVLTAVLTPLSILASFNYIKERQREFYSWMLILHAAMLGVFMARDLLLFYLFFEFTLIPMFFIIGIWGGPDRRKAAASSSSSPSPAPSSRWPR